MLSAASDVLCAAFNESNGVYMAEAGLSHPLVKFSSMSCGLFRFPGRVIEHIRDTRDAAAGAEVADISQQRRVAATAGEWA